MKSTVDEIRRRFDADVDRRDESTIPIVQLAVHLDGFARFRDQADERFFLSVGSIGPQENEDDDCFAEMLHFSTS